MKVKLEYRNKDMKLVASKEVPFADYCTNNRDKLIDLLSDIEMLLVDSGVDYRCSLRYKKIRHNILDLAGAMERLPKSIV